MLKVFSRPWSQEWPWDYILANEAQAGVLCGPSEKVLQMSVTQLEGSSPSRHLLFRASCRCDGWRALSGSHWLGGSNPFSSWGWLEKRDKIIYFKSIFESIRCNRSQSRIIGPSSVRRGKPIGESLDLLASFLLRVSSNARRWAEVLRCWVGLSADLGGPGVSQRWGPW